MVFYYLQFRFWLDTSGFISNPNLPSSFAPLRAMVSKAEKVVVQLRLKDWQSRHKRVRSLFNTALYDEITALMGPDELLWAKSTKAKTYERLPTIALPCFECPSWVHDERNHKKQFVCGNERPRRQATMHRFTQIAKRRLPSVVIPLADKE